MTFKKRVHLICLILSLVTFAVGTGVGRAAAESSKPKTVGDFLLLVPERYMIGYDLRFREELLRGEHRGVVIDISNGYISYDASDNPSGFEFAIFRKSNGRYIVAYNTVGDDFNWEPGDPPTLQLLSYDGGKWRDVSKALLPVALDNTLGYTLPRRGRNIEVTGKGGRKVYTLNWVKDRFRLKRAARR